MTFTITLNPEMEAQLRSQAEQQGQDLNYLIGQLLHQALNPDPSELDDALPIHFYTPVAQLTDAEVMELAALKMNAAQNHRLGELQAHGKAQGLPPAERYELFTLMQIYRLGLLRKSEALAEAHQRGLAIH
ncbi:hypothetical protein [Spirulina major]|uniref:hypothetical protein n=1 Tax=Spirulina major TaxID=270636 RepID=UPI000935619A|nr:hypothetical protein [Spirulina major]